MIFHPDRIPVAIAALALCVMIGMVTGPLAGNANPVLWRVIDLLFGPLGRRLNNTERSVNELAVRGFFLTILGMGFALILSRLAGSISYSYPQWRIAETLMLCLTMSAGAVWFAQLRLVQAIESEKTLKGGFLTIARTTRTDMTGSDEFTMTRLGLGLGAKSFDKAVVGPILWFLIAGLPGAYLYAGLAALSWRFGKEGYSKGFGTMALTLEKLMGFIPNLFSAVFIAMAGLFTPTGGMTRAMAGLGPVKNRARYEEGGMPVTTLAYALDVSLGGPSRDLEGSAIQRNWVGPEKATAQLTARHVYRGLYLVFIAHILLLVSLLGAIVIGGHDMLDF